MTATIQTARDDIMRLVRDELRKVEACKYIKIVYENTKASREQANEANTKNPKPWIRISVRHAGGEQQTLSNGSGQARYNRRGIVIVQIFTPLGDGFRAADKIMEAALGAFEGQATPNGVWFRNARPQEIGADGPWFQVNVVSDFTYDNVK